MTQRLHAHRTVLMLHACTSLGSMVLSDSLLCNLLDFLWVDLCRYEGLRCVVYARLHLLERILNIVPASARPGYGQHTTDN